MKKIVNDCPKCGGSKIIALLSNPIKYVDCSRCSDSGGMPTPQHEGG